MHGNVRAKKSFEFSLNVNAVFPSHRKPTRQLQIWNYIYARPGRRWEGEGARGRGEERKKRDREGEREREREREREGKGEKRKKRANTRYAYA